MDIDAMDRFYVLKMMHSDAEFISNSIVCYRDISDKNIIIIADLDGNELYSVPSPRMVIIGKFVIMCSNAINSGELKVHKIESHIASGALTVFNCDTHKEMKIKSFVSCVMSANYMGDNYLMFKVRTHNDDYDEMFANIYNKDLTVSDIMPRPCFNLRINVLKETTTHVVLSTSLMSTRNKYAARVSSVIMIFNKLTGKFEQYQSRDVTDTIKIVATDINKAKSQDLSVSNECIDYLTYKLSVNGNVVTEHEYQDIAKPSVLTYTDYFYVYDNGNDCKLKKGLIDISGKELLEPLYDDIQYIGSNNFILESNGFSMIYNTTEKRIVVGYNQNNGIKVHSHLPLTLIYGVDKTIYCLDTRGNLFNIKDFSKYFECYKSNDFFGIKVNIGNGIYKYVDEQLEPITNIRLLGQLQAYTWVRI